jgi:two-component system, LytTR family, response regulator
MMNYLVIDDESHARENTRLLIQAIRPDFHFLGSANSLCTGRALILEKNPDLVFLDIELRDGNGFDLLESLPERNFTTIFVTAYASYSLRAFQFAALDYLLKPIDSQLLAHALNRLGHGHLLALQLQVAQQSYNAPRSSRLLLPTLDGFLVLQTEDIIRCEADANYTHFHFKGHKPILASHNLAHYEELLSSNDFVRVHHKHLVNLAQVVGYQRGRGGAIELSDRSQVEVSVRKRDEFLAAMQRFAKGWR